MVCPPLAESTALNVIALVIGIFFFAFPIVIVYFFVKWFRAAQRGDPDVMQKGLGRLLGRTKFGPLIAAYTRLRQAGIQIPDSALAEHMQAGGDVPRVVNWLVAAKSAGLEVPFDQLCKLDLAGELPDVESSVGLDPAQLAAALHKE